MCLLVHPTLNYQLTVFSPWYLLVHNGSSNLIINLNIVGLFLPETYTNADTILASVQVISHVHHTGLVLGGSVEIK